MLLKLLSFRFLLLVLALLIFDFFVWFDWFRVRWSRYLSLIVIKIVCGMCTNRYTGFFPPQDLGRSWWGWWLVVHYFWHQWIICIDLKYPSSSLTKTDFVDFLPLFFASTESAFIDPDNFPWMLLKIVYGFYTNHT